MTEFIRELFSKGKITIPREIRELYGIRDGDFVQMKILGVVRAGSVAPGEEPAVERIQEISSVALGIRDLASKARSKKDEKEATS